MYTQKKVFFMISETPVHAGSGSDLGIVDLPIQREKHTGYPKIEASGIKGVIREYFDKRNQLLSKEKLEIIFGSEEGDGSSSAVSFIDARILFFPIKSVKGIFAYVTCNDVLSRFQRDLKLFNNKINLNIDNIPVNSICSNSSITKNNVNQQGDNVVLLEEYSFEDCRVNNELTNFAAKIRKILYPYNSYWAQKIEKDIIVIDNDIFKDFVELYSEVIARTRIDSDTGTVAKGALWYEEYLPPDTILYSCIMTTNPFIQKDKCPEEINSDIKILNKLTSIMPKTIQIGGNTTIGKGLMRLEFINENVFINDGGE